MKEHLDQSTRHLAEVERHQGIEKLKAIMRCLRDEQGGCPWDRQQNYESLLPCTIEEVYEVVEAIEQKNFAELKGELGDLLFQVIFYAQLANEENRFDFEAIVESICEKLLRRHPHVFGGETFSNDAQLHSAWEAGKTQERMQRQGSELQDLHSLLDDIPKVLPELKRAQKIQRRVAQGGFDWPDISHVWAKLEEEKLEVLQAAEEKDAVHLEEELGDLMFTLVNLTRHYGVDADIAMRKANQKFERRFRQLEQIADQPLANCNIEQLEALWQKAKIDLE